MATGFGGSPGLSILAGAAKGMVGRQEQQREAQRQAILNRLRERQAERVAQDMRLSAEGAEVARQDREKKQQDEEQRLVALKDSAISNPDLYGLGHVSPGELPGVAERYGQAGLNARLELRKREASLKQTVSSTRGNEIAQMEAQARLKSVQDDIAANDLTTNPAFAQLASIGTDPAIIAEVLNRAGGVKVTARTINRAIELRDQRIQRLTRRRSDEALTRKREADTDSEGGGGGSTGIGAAAARGQENDEEDTLLNSPGDSRGGGAGGEEAFDVGAATDAYVERFGSPEAALRALRRQLAGMNEDHPRHSDLEAVVNELVGR